MSIDKRYTHKLRDDRIKEMNIDGYITSSQPYSNRVYKSKTLPKAPNYTPDNYDYRFIKEAIAVKDLVIGQQNRQRSNEAGHTAFNVMGYDQMINYVLPIQRHLIEIGYLEKGSDDGIMGPKTEGAIKRYDYNRPSVIEEAWYGIKNMDINPFD